jgi:excinuclease ABC subunit A
MGPAGGAGGGVVAAWGSREEVAAAPASHTGKCLREVRSADRISDAEAVRAPARSTARKTVAARSAAKKTVTAKSANNTATKKAAAATKKAAPAKKTTRARKA